MSPNTDPGSNRDSRQRKNAPTQSYPGPRLEFTVVEYDGRPDRCTVYPADGDATKRLTTWISVDESTVRSLAQMR